MNLLLRIAALLLLTVATAAPAAPPTPLEGYDYELIEGGAPFAAPAGTVEVAEVFGYACPHCAHFEPALQAWAKTLPAQARLVPVPADFRDDWVPFARGYFAAQSLGIAQRSHAAMYEALHDRQTLPLSGTTPDEIAAFYRGYGVAPARFLAAYRSAAVDAQLKRAHDFVVRSGIDGTPALVVAGRYRVVSNSRDRQLATARWLVERELAARTRR